MTDDYCTCGHAAYDHPHYDPADGTLYAVAPDGTETVMTPDACAFCSCPALTLR